MISEAWFVARKKNDRSIAGWMDGWIDGWMNVWVGGWMDGYESKAQAYICKQEKHTYMCKDIDRQTDRHMDKI